MIEQKIRKRMIVIRKIAGLSARQLSLRISCAEGYINKFENGQSFVSMDNLESMLKACDSSFEELFSENFESYRKDKQIYSKIREVTPEDKDPLLTLLVAMEKLENSG
ncbi:MAG: helix-turn-helix domain-containing protein [Firmicutes bacterium]|nr:helix-turn-helix domain-containing protein [Bacillota bacterium]